MVDNTPMNTKTMNLNYRILAICISIFVLCGNSLPERASGADGDLEQVRQQAARFLNGLVRMSSEDKGDREYWEKQPDTYVELRKIGELLNESMVLSLRNAPAGDPVTEILLVADEVARRPKALDELRQWYGRKQGQIPVEFLMSHLPPGRERDELVAKKGPPPPGSLPRTFRGVAGRKAYRLRPEHATPEYRLAWEAILLAVPSKEKMTIRENTFEALARIKDPRTLPIITEYFRSEIGIAPHHWHLGKEQAEKALGLISKFESREMLDAFLECFKLAEAQGRADDNKPGFSVRWLITNYLVGDDGYKGDPGYQHRKHETLVKARLLANKNDPKTYPLTDSQRHLLEEALRIAAIGDKRK